MKTWRDVKWTYDDKSGRVVALVDGKVVDICRIASRWFGDDAATIGRAIAHAWNMDLAQTQWSRELFGDTAAP